MLDEHGKALTMARECAHRAPDLPLCFSLRAVAASQMGDTQEAQDTVRRLLELNPKMSVSRSMVFRDEADTAKYRRLLLLAGMPE